MSILEAIVLGIVQGLTEFLPVSSSGHLVLLQNVFGFSEPQLFFDTMLHLGTLVAVVIVMRNEIIDLFKKPFHTLGYLVIATIPAVIVALLLNDFVEGAFAGTYLGYGFLFTAVVLTLSEVLSKRRRQKRRSIGAGSAAVMGLMQAIAIFPGVSRSGSSIAGGLASGLDRKKAATFSFLMSIPVILGSVLLQGYKIVGSNISVDWAPTIIGAICAAISGYFAVRFMLALIQKKRLYGFAVYVLILGIFVLLDQYVLGMINWA
jgi:undecaprenyl-diphosphatase